MFCVRWGCFFVLTGLGVTSENGLNTESWEEDEDRDNKLPRTSIINTKKGKIQGRVHDVTRRDFKLGKVEIYLGIPYASPPIGERRFAPTQARSPWEGILQATTQGPACPQMFPQINNRTEALTRMTKARLEYISRVKEALKHQAEECLHLNVFKPHQRIGLAVMVFIHGDSWEWGSSSLYDGRVLSSLGQVVVVTFNYRLGILGFLNPNPSPLRKGQVANYGLVDQMAALQWVTENIRQFGGDPARVTLMGHGTGAASLEYLAHSPMIHQGHFQRVILMSGSIFSGWSRVANPSEVAVSLARQLGCGIPANLHQNFNNILQCLRHQSMEALTKVVLDHPSFLPVWGPSYDGVTVKNNFRGIKSKRSFGARSYEALIGCVSHDWFHSLSEQQLEEGVKQQDRDNIFRTYTMNNYDNHLMEIFLAVQNEYTDWEQVVQHPVSVRDQVVQALSDAMYAGPAIHSVGSFYRRGNNSYFYHFNHQTKDGIYAKHPRAGSTHGEEVPYILGIPLVRKQAGADKDSDDPLAGLWPSLQAEYTRSEALLSALLITYWTNFAKTGNPNSPLKLEDVISKDVESKRFKMIKWDPYDEHRKYIELDVRSRVRHSYRGHRLSLWLRLAPQLEHSGTQGSLPGHGSIHGPTWGRVRNMSGLPGAQQISLGEPATTCSPLAPGNTSSSPVDGGESYGPVVLAAVLAAVVLCLVNGLVLLCLCYRKDRRDKLVYRGHMEHMEHHAQHREELCYDSTECLNNSVPHTPHQSHRLPTFSSVGRNVDAVAGSMVRRGSRRDNVPLSFMSPPSILSNRSETHLVDTYRTTGHSYIPIPPPDSIDFPAIALQANIPPPGPFNEGNNLREVKDSESNS